MPRDTTRRLLDVVLTLTAAGGTLSFDEIRSRIEAYDTRDPESGRRTFERDKDTLREMGIVLEYEEAEHGYRLDAGASFLEQPVPLDPDDRALLLGLAEDALGSPGFPYPEALAMAVAKIGETENGRPPFLAHHPLHDDPTAIDRFLATLHDALVRRKRVTMTYRPVARDAAARTVEPYGLFLAGGHWYLCARDVDQDALRVYRLSRIVDLECDDRAPKTPDFEVPGSFRLAEYAELDPVRFHFHEPTVVTVRVDDEVAHLARGLWGEPTADDACVFEVETTNAEAVVEQVLGFGRRAEILSPDSIRGRMAEVLQALLDGHEVSW